MVNKVFVSRQRHLVVLLSRKQFENEEMSPKNRAKNVQGRRYTFIRGGCLTTGEQNTLKFNSLLLYLIYKYKYNVSKIY